MISASKLAALRLSLQPLTCFAVTPNSGPVPTPAVPYTPGPLSASHLSQQQQFLPPKPSRLSPVPDASLCSPTPTRAAFLLTPTRFAFPTIPSPSEAEATSPFLSIDPRSPMFSTCVCEGCDNVVSSERNTCAKCREVFLTLLSQQKTSLAQMHVRSPVEDLRPSMGPLSPRSHSSNSNTSRQSDNAVFQRGSAATMVKQEGSSTAATCARGPLSVAHPRPCPIDTSRRGSGSAKAARKPESDLEDLASPDALYFGKRSRRTYGHNVARGRNPEPTFTNLKTSARMQKVQDEDMLP
ncbi:hypothetical protein P389DRAFT_212584 [Cystobasidium minutum MCA 4210]|uniref:uncharacterized protein n=1 Tax=Cystobasidium minutum MCA 4210 TaxID=1397322 RepID=UPI0034CE2401|eukprot:jgi/Rhomi1/212584/estExt_Genemark1.C_70073